MISLINKNDEVIVVDFYEDFCIKHKSDGNDTMSLVVDTRHDHFNKFFEEAIIITDENEWIVKKIDDDKIDCELNFDAFKRNAYLSYNSGSKSLTDILSEHLPLGFTFENANLSTIRRTIELKECTEYDILQACMETFSVNFVWKLREKRLIVYKLDMIEPSGEYITSELNLENLSFKGDTVNFATRLYAYGKEGLTLESAVVDNVEYGLTYLDNNDYSNKVISTIWVDDRYEDANSLYDAASKKLKTLSFPVRSYDCSVVDLAKLNDEYSFLDFKLHKKITLIDIERNIKVVHSIVEYIEYPDSPQKNKITLSGVPETINTSVKSIANSVKDETEKITTNFDSRIAMATAMITGAFGGNVLSNGEELFIMDNVDPNLAQVVWRWNVNGFGKSSTGINGPYTTALTFDDTFITNVINAMTIKGSLIEAESLTADKISVSYTDDVLKQSFEAAAGLVSFNAEETKNLFSNDEQTGLLDVLEKRQTEIEQSIEGLEINVTEKFVGGINLVKNSAGLNGISDDWIVENGVVRTKTSSNTMSKSTFIFYSDEDGDTTLTQTINDVLADDYFVSIKAKKGFSGLTAKAVVKYNGDKEKILFSTDEEFEWSDFSAVLEDVTSDTISIEFSSPTENLYVSDILIAAGSAKQNWSPAPNEIYTAEVKVDKRGIEVGNSESSQKTVITNSEFAGYYNDELVFTVNKDETQTKKTSVDGELTVGKVKFIPTSSQNGLNIVVLD